MTYAAQPAQIQLPHRREPHQTAQDVEIMVRFDRFVFFIGIVMCCLCCRRQCYYF